MIRDASLIRGKVIALIAASVPQEPAAAFRRPQPRKPRKPTRRSGGDASREPNVRGAALFSFCSGRGRRRPRGNAGASAWDPRQWVAHAEVFCSCAVPALPAMPMPLPCPRPHPPRRPSPPQQAAGTSALLQTRSKMRQGITHLLRRSAARGMSASAAHGRAAWLSWGGEALLP
eukprot:349593-Chlamydomonas_euryale.AAC.8